MEDEVEEIKTKYKSTSKTYYSIKSNFYNNIKRSKKKFKAFKFELRKNTASLINKYLDADTYKPINKKIRHWFNVLHNFQDSNKDPFNDLLTDNTRTYEQFIVDQKEIIEVIHTVFPTPVTQGILNTIGVIGVKHLIKNPDEQEVRILNANTHVKYKKDTLFVDSNVSLNRTFDLDKTEQLTNTIMDVAYDHSTVPMIEVVEKQSKEYVPTDDGEYEYPDMFDDGDGTYVPTDGDIEKHKLKHPMDKAKVNSYYYLHPDYHKTAVDEYIHGPPPTILVIYKLVKFFMANPKTENEVITMVRFTGSVDPGILSNFDGRADVHQHGPIKFSDPALTRAKVTSYMLQDVVGCNVVLRDIIYSNTILNNLHSPKITGWTSEPRTAYAQIKSAVSVSSAYNFPRHLDSVNQALLDNTIDVLTHTYCKNRMINRFNHIGNFPK